MNKKFQIALAALAVFTLTSCNRGMGCPSDFSAGDLIQTIISILPL